MSFKNTRNYRNGLIPNHCEIPDCGFDAMVTRHRIKPGRNGGKYILGNVIGLCPNHHSEAEAGILTQFELFEIVRRRVRNQLGKDNNMKICSKCGEEKLFEEFHKSSQTPDGYRYECRLCRSEARRGSYSLNKEVEREAIYAWRKKNPDRIREYTRRYQLKSRYGLTEEQYDELLNLQGGVCAICEAEPNGSPLHVDHDHETQGIRGLLCSACNLGLGNFRDSPKLMYEAAVYVGGWES